MAGCLILGADPVEMCHFDSTTALHLPRTGRPILHGRYCRAALARRREWLAVLRGLNDLIDQIDG